MTKREKEAINDAVKYLNAILNPFPCSVGSAEDSLEEWMDAVTRHRNFARVAKEILEKEVLKNE